MASPTGRVYFHEIPGGQLSNLRQQAIALGLGDRFEDVENMYAAANRILGNLVKVTPSSKVVGDLALALVGAGADPADFEANPTAYDIPDSVIGFLEGELGDPPGGWPEPFRTKALQGRHAKPRTTELTPEQEQALQTTPQRTLNELLFPGPTRDFESSREKYGNLGVLWQNAGDPTRARNYYQESLRHSDAIVATTNDPFTKDQAVVARSRTYLNMATVFFQVGDVGRARDLLRLAWDDRSAVLEPDDPQLLALKGFLIQD